VTEPFTVAAIGAVALSQGVGFLYGQAADLLRRWRERRDAAAADAEPLLVAPAAGADPSVLAGALRQVAVDEDVLRDHQEQMIELTERLGSYANGIRQADPGDEVLVAQVEALRGLLELAYRQRITFRGERREPSGGSVDVDLTVQRVNGDLTLARIKSVRGGGHLNVTGNIDVVDKDGHVTGFQGDTLGG
jgi:hypothetical protein